ncbi:hypothetical protein FF38_02269 [Lucilia cuprina]|uniref:Uncharacterized protein n=1 Tax=Lucilia cuprina TaxID=7375 RepID=A0A0L0CI37_LUCCU|nr:hypothetical protein FF38_02269 [Lucilia cuprina]
MQQSTDYEDNPIFNEDYIYYGHNYSEDDDDEGDYANTTYLVEYQPPPPMLMGYDEYRRQFIRI